MGRWVDLAGVADRLRRAGHDVHTPSLAGLAERAHVPAAEPITLSTTGRCNRGYVLGLRHTMKAAVSSWTDVNTS